MARPLKQTVDYFPHYVNHGKTLLIIENEFGNVGYSFWFKVIELLCTSDGQIYDYSKPAAWRLLLAKTSTTRETATEILALLADVDAIDAELHKHKIIWVQNLIDNLDLVYSRRSTGKPKKPVIVDGNLSFNGVIANINPTQEGVIADNNTQTKLNKTKQYNTEANGDFSTYINDLQTNRYPQLKVGELWEDCQSWYEDHNKPMKDAKRALNNWCKKEMGIHPPKSGKSLPTAKELKEGWNQ